MSIKVLIISRSPWRDDSNEGSVFTNLFNGLDFEFANVYCQAGNPNNELCYKYFQLTDKQALKNILKKQKMGNVIDVKLNLNDTNKTQNSENENKKFYDFFRKNNFEIFYLLKEILWKLSNYKNSDLLKFVNEFNPDIVFSPLCYSASVLDVQKYILNNIKKPAITYIYDDVYSFKQFRISIFYWINRFILRKAIKDNMNLYNLAYTMTKEQKLEYEKYFDINIEIMRKSAIAPEVNNENNEMKFIYAGGIYYGRDKTLCKVVNAIKIANDQGIKSKLNIFTNSPLSKKTRKILDDKINSTIYNTVSFDILKEKYSNSNIALHVEDFSLKNTLTTRLSFSTKIIDCLASGCATMAIGPSRNAGISYLKNEDAAICIIDKKNIENQIIELISNQENIEKYKQKAKKCLEKNHRNEINQQQILEDFYKVIGG